jgi:hypothetical protein
MKTAFISYSHVDEQFRAELEKHLSLLRRQGHVETWSDHRIAPGEGLEQSISTALETANVILLLVSADFLNSDYCYGVEMKRALERHEAGEAVVVPIIIRSCDWPSSPFGRVKALPTDGKPVAKWSSLDDAFLDVVQKLRPLLAAPAKGSASHHTAMMSSAPRRAEERAEPVFARQLRSSNLALPRKFTDEDKHDFVIQSFQYIRTYFEQSLGELQQRNAGITGRLTDITNLAFTAVVFREGRRAAGCSIRLGSTFSANGIAYSGSERASDNSYNELLTVEHDSNMMYLKAMMGRMFSQDPGRLTDEGAAEHLWSMFIEPLQHG